MRRLIALSIVSSIALLPSMAYAACVSNDLTGRWQAYFSFSLASGGSLWARCLLRISAGGTIEDTTCPSVRALPFTDGSLSLINANRCTFTGEFVIEGNDAEIKHATIASEKDTAGGVGILETGIFTFDMFKLN